MKAKQVVNLALKKLWYILLLPIQSIRSIFDNDSHFIISDRGYKVLNCKHEEWDIDCQIRVIQCKSCGTRAWLRDTKNLFEK